MGDYQERMKEKFDMGQAVDILKQAVLQCATHELIELIYVFIPNFVGEIFIKKNAVKGGVFGKKKI